MNINKLLLITVLLMGNKIHAEEIISTTPLKCTCPNKQITFAIIKPEAVRDGKSGDIIKYIELNGFNIKDMIKKEFSKNDAELFYQEHKEKPFFRDLVTYMTSGPVIVLALEKENAIQDWRKLMGPTDPTKADVGTIRKMFGKSMQENAVHGSANVEDAKTELQFLQRLKQTT